MLDECLSSITLHQLRIFSAIAREGSFTRAAEALYLSEPNVSDQVKLLERLVGARLLDRSPGRRKVELTEAGTILYQSYDQMDRELRRAAQALRTLRGGDQEIVAFGCGSHFGASALPAVHETFRHAHPGVGLQIEIDERSNVVRRLEEGSLDVAILAGGSDSPSLICEPLADYSVVIVGPPGHRLSSLERPAAFRLLAAEQFILPGRSSAVSQTIHNMACDASIGLDIVLEVSNVEARIQAVRAGLGITALCACGIKTQVAAGQLSVLQVDGFPLRIERFIARRPAVLRPPAQAFLDHLIRYRALLAGC